MFSRIDIDINGMDDNQHTATLDSFINLAESPCGFGNTEKEAVQDLLTQI